MQFNEHDYQAYGRQAILKQVGLFLMLEMGLGKTVTSLAAVMELLNGLNVFKPLVIAPKRVTEQTWPDEIAKWDHLKGLTISVIAGNEQQRRTAAKAKADIYAVSRDNIAWLIKAMGRHFDFDMLVLDESSSFKNPKSKRFKALKSAIGKFRRTVLLSGTPMSNNGYLDLWAQYYLIDRGQRLGSTLGGYRTRYFDSKVIDDSMRLKYFLKPGAKEAIWDAIGDITISMREKDLLNIPERIDLTETVRLGRMAEYEAFMRDRVLELGDRIISPENAGVLYGKALQFCNGAVYYEKGKWEEVGTEKLDVLEEEIESLIGRPALIFYNFRSDIERIRERMPFVREMKTPQDIRDWNDGKVEAMALHPNSGGHGLNLQYGGHNVFWFGIPWSSETYSQAVKRVHRQGVREVVVNKRIMSTGTVEDLVSSSLARNIFNTDELVEYFNVYRK